MRVYIVEDHLIMQKMLVEAVSRQPGCSVCGVAASAEEALDELPGCGAGLALVDVSLPGMNGIELVLLLAQQAPDLRCVMVSGHVEPAYAQRALDAGACGYVLKGRPTDLERAVAACIAGDLYISEPLRAELAALRAEATAEPHPGTRLSSAPESGEYESGDGKYGHHDDHTNPYPSLKNGGDRFASRKGERKQYEK